MTLDEAKKIIKNECYIADLLNLDRTQMVNTALDTVIEAAEQQDTDLDGYSSRLWHNAYERGKADAEVTRWIPVSERLPKEGYEVLITICRVTYPPLGLCLRDVGIGWLSDGEWRSNDFEYDEPVFIEAWMPLPQPYKAEGSDEE